MDPQDTETCRQLIESVCEDLMNEAAVEHETAKMLIDQRDVPRGEESQDRPRLARRAPARAQGELTGDDICPEGNGKGKTPRGETCRNCGGTGKVVRGIGGG